MSGNVSLRKAKQVKNDEFYTQLSDIESELKNYREQFKGKTVFCNCDDPYESNFFKYFALNFNFLGLKKLIATCYDKSPVAYTQLSFFGDGKTTPNTNRKAYKIEITEVDDYNGDGAFDLSDVKYLLKNKQNSLTLLKGDGDFRSDECIELLKEADIVCTNPPFSLFHEYLAQLVEYNKSFLIIGNKNSLAHKEIFALLQSNKMWLGYRNVNSDMWLEVPEENNFEKIVDGKKLKHIMACWFTNLDTKKRHEEFTSYRKYAPEDYPKYDNYNAINIDKVTDIPYDYDGVMGVPITFFDKYNPDQFEIIGLGIASSGLKVGVQPYKPNHKKYRKEVQHKGAVDGDLYMLDENGHPNVPYSRILIKWRK